MITSCVNIASRCGSVINSSQFTYNLHASVSKLDFKVSISDVVIRGRAYSTDAAL